MSSRLHRPAAGRAAGCCFSPRRAVRALAVLCLLAIASGTARGQVEPARLFAEGNRAYEQGRFADAISAYEQILRYGVHNAAAYYNLGNAYYKQGQLGKAILNYEKARLLNPGDRDIVENLAFVNALRIDRVEEPETPVWLSLMTRIHNLFALDTQLAFLATLWALANAGLLLRLLRPEHRLRRPAGLLSAASLLLMLPGLVSAVVRIQQLGQQEAIVISEKADVLSGPAEGNAVLVTVHEGLKVEVRGEAPGWVQVILPNGWNGWLTRASVGRVDIRGPSQ